MGDCVSFFTVSPRWECIYQYLKTKQTLHHLQNQQPRPKGAEYEPDLNLLVRRDSR